MKKLFTTALVTFVSQILMAQTSSDIRFNEISIQRDSTGNVTNAWVELYNTSCTSVNMTGLYISNDPNNLKKYKVPYGSEATQFMPRGYQVIDIDGKTAEGPLHTPFTISQSQQLYLVQANGRVIIDSLTVPQAGTLARVTDGAPEWQATSTATKGYSNVTDTGIGNVEKFMKIDPYGGGMALISMSVVFSVLIMLAVAFSLIGRLFKKHDNKKDEQATAPVATAVSKTSDDNDDNDDITAVAIAVAIHRNQRHDSVKGKLTITGKVNRLWKNTFLNTIINQRREWH